MLIDDLRAYARDQSGYPSGAVVHLCNDAADALERAFQRLAALASEPVAGTATPQQVQEACAKVADRLAEREDTDYGTALVAQKIAASIRALIPPAPPAPAGREAIASELARFFPGKQWLRDQAADAILALGATVTPQGDRTTASAPRPMAYYVEHPSYGVELSLDPPDVASEDRGWVATPLYATPPAPGATDRADALRYRWLRDRDLETIDKGGVFAGTTPENLIVNGEDLDRRIDDAMASEVTRADGGAK